MILRPKQRKVAHAISAALWAALVIAAASACDTNRVLSTAPSAPAIRSAVVGGPQLATALSRTTPLLRDTTVSITLEGAGGTIDIAPLGFHLVIPRSALPTEQPITISVTAVAGDAVAYRFAPHGIVFDRSILASQDLANTTWAGNTGQSTLEAGYFADDAALDQAAGTAEISEYFPTTLTATGNRVRWGIPHFSGYVIVTGKK